MGNRTPRASNRQGLFDRHAAIITAASGGRAQRPDQSSDGATLWIVQHPVPRRIAGVVMQREAREVGQWSADLAASGIQAADAARPGAGLIRLLASAR